MSQKTNNYYSNDRIQTANCKFKCGTKNKNKSSCTCEVDNAVDRFTVIREVGLNNTNFGDKKAWGLNAMIKDCSNHERIELLDCDMKYETSKNKIEVD